MIKFLKVIFKNKMVVMEKSDSFEEASSIPLKEYHHITAHQTWFNYLKEIFSYHELFYFLIWRDILVRYKQTIFGLAWALIRPLLTMVILTFVFQRMAHFNSGSISYYIFVLTALIPWQFFCDSILFGTSSLLINEQLISKIYFPRILIPASYVISSFLDCLLCFLLLLICVGSFHVFPPFYKLLFSFFCLLWTIVISIVITSFLSVLIVQYRDIRYAVPFIMQMGLYLSPIGFSYSYLSIKMQVIYSLNPLVGIINGLRWCFCDERLYLQSIVIGIMTTFFYSYIALTYFKISEKNLADVI